MGEPRAVTRKRSWCFSRYPLMGWAGGLLGPGLASPRRPCRALVLLGGPEGDLDLDSHAGRREAEDVAGVVVTRNRRDPGVQVGELGCRLGAAEGVGLLSGDEEGLWPCRPGSD